MSLRGRWALGNPGSRHLVCTRIEAFPSGDFDQDFRRIGMGNRPTALRRLPPGADEEAGIQPPLLAYLALRNLLLPFG